MRANDIRAFAREQVLPTLARRYQERSFSRELWRQMADAGLFGFLAPEEFGGSNLGPEALLDAVDAFLDGGCDLGLCLSWLDHVMIHTHVIQRFGTPAQREASLPGLIGGDRIGALAASEPGTGADPGKMRCTATPENGGYAIRGQKVFITNGPLADRVIVLARTGPAPGKEGISAFLVDARGAGFQVRRVMDFGFLHTAPHAELIFHDCRVPGRNLLGGIGEGHTRVSRAVFAWERHILLWAMAAHFRAMLDRLVEKIRRGAGARASQTEQRVAAAHVNLQGLREYARQRAVLALAGDRLDREGMERLLFMGHAFFRWWEDLQRLLRGVDIADDPVLAIQVNDARLLEIDRKLYRIQMGRIGRELARPPAGS